MRESWCPFFQQKVLRKSGRLVDWTPLLAWEKRQVIGGSHTLRVMGLLAVDGCWMRSNIKMDMAITQPVGNPGCFVLKITVLMEMAFERRALEFSFLKNTDRSDQEKGLTIFEAKWSFIVYILGNVGGEGSAISNCMWKLGKKWTVGRGSSCFRISA